MEKLICGIVNGVVPVRHVVELSQAAGVGDTIEEAYVDLLEGWCASKYAFRVYVAQMIEGKDVTCVLCDARESSRLGEAIDHLAWEMNPERPMQEYAHLHDEA